MKHYLCIKDIVASTQGAVNYNGNVRTAFKKGVIYSDLEEHPECISSGYSNALLEPIKDNFEEVLVLLVGTSGDCKDLTYSHP